MLVALSVIAGICGLVIAGVYQLTRPIIVAAQAQALADAVFSVIPSVVEVNAFELDGDRLERTDATILARPGLYAGYDVAGHLIGTAIEAAGQGYQDIIRVLYGYDPYGERIVGFQVLESRETPGLGDKITRDPAFLANFDDLDVALAADGRTASRPIQVVDAGSATERHQIDAITGATVSSNAVGDLLSVSVESWARIVQANLAVLEASR